MPILVNSAADLDRILGSQNLTIVHFYAEWLEQCLNINNVLDELAKLEELSGATFCYCNAEELSDVSLKYKIEAVPTVLFIKNESVIDRLEGADASELTAMVKKHGGKAEPLEKRLSQLINKHEVMVFMKGDRENPKCGFSRQLIQILGSTKVEYCTFDILNDEEVRQGLKKYSDWPTYPQVYVKGDLIGGLDIVKQLETDGSLLNVLQGKTD